MATVPATATRRRHRRRHRRQQPRPPPGPARLARHRPDRQGAAAQPGRLDRPRLELHLPGRPLAGDHRPDARLGAAVQGDGRLHRVRRLRGRPHRGADGGAAAADVRRRRPGASRPSWSRPEFVQEKVPFLDTDQIIGAFWTPSVGRRRLAARRHDHARAGDGARARSPSSHRRGRPASTSRTGRDPPGAHQRRRHRGRDRRHRLRRVEPEDRRHGRRRASR